MAQVAAAKLKLIGGYRRTESEPTHSSVNNIRCRFETTDVHTAPVPETKPPHAHRKSIAVVSQVSEPTSPATTVVTARHLTKGLPVKQLSDSHLEIPSNKSIQVQLPVIKKVVKPNTLTLDNRDTSKQCITDKRSLIELQSTGIVSARRQKLVSPVISPNPGVLPTTPTSINSTKVRRLKPESITNKSDDSRLIKARELTSPGSPTTISKPSTLVGTPSRDERPSLPDAKPRSPLTFKQPAAKSFWKTLSHDADMASLESPSSIFEPGVDYTKLKKVSTPPVINSPTPTTSNKQKIESKSAQAVAANLGKVSEKLGQHRPNSLPAVMDDSKPLKQAHKCSLSKSSSVSSNCSSMDSMEIDYMNGPFSHKIRRRDTKPPQNIVARRTQLFEKSVQEINSIHEEAEAYNKVKDEGFGLVFKPKDNKDEESEPVTPPVRPKITCVPMINARPHQKSTALVPPPLFKPKDKNIINNNSTREVDKNGQTPLVMRNKESKIMKPLPSLPPSARRSVNEETGRGGTPLTPKSKGAGPVKPPRTFEHTEEAGFDPVVIPRQAGDGEENPDYECHVSCQPHVYTAVTISPGDTRHSTYAVTTTADSRHYTSLTTTDTSLIITDGSGGDESVAGSENAYDTLGRASVASSYEHYDTISQSELDSDVSRPPTLPRRPSNLRHRPLSTSLSHLDVSTKSQSNNLPSAAFQIQLNKALTTTVAAQTIRETSSPTSPSPTKARAPGGGGGGFKLRYLLPKARRKADDMRKASSMVDLLDDNAYSVYDSVEVLKPNIHINNQPVSMHSCGPALNFDVPVIDEAGYALPDIKVSVTFILGFYLFLF